jgi:hypothetical protein
VLELQEHRIRAGELLHGSNLDPSMAAEIRGSGSSIIAEHHRDRRPIACVPTASREYRSAGGASATVPSASQARPGVAANSPPAGAVLEITALVRLKNGKSRPMPNRGIWVMKGSADSALIDGGFSQTPDGSILHHFMVACRQRTPECQRGMRAIEARTVSFVRVDSSGRGRTSPVAPGRYYVFSTVVLDDQPLAWQEPIDLRPGINSIALDQVNAQPVQRGRKGWFVYLRVIDTDSEDRRFTARLASSFVLLLPQPSAVICRCKSSRRSSRAGRRW